MSDEYDKSAEDELKLVKDLACKLSVKFDTVQVICTRHISEDEGTRVVRYGVGNVLARVQSCREYVTRQDEIDRQDIEQ